MSRSDAAWQCSKHQKAIHYMMEKLEVSGPNALLSTSRWKQRRRHSEFLHSARWWGHRCRLGLHRKAWSPNPPQQHTVAYLVNSYSNNFPFSFGFLTCFSWLATSVLEARFLGSKAGRQGNLKFSLVEHGQATLGSFSSKLLLMWPCTLHRCSAAFQRVWMALLWAPGATSGGARVLGAQPYIWLSLFDFLVSRSSA